ncbi:hypothetical protein N5P37_004158, partial [Trichoderma harzianum]
VWLYNLPNYQGAVYEYDGSQYGCQTIGKGLYVPFFIYQHHSQDERLTKPKVLDSSTSQRMVEIARSIECETWEP